MKVRDGSISRILVFLGGSDPDNMTIRTLEAIELLDRTDINVDVVLGSQYLHHDAINQKTALVPYVTIYENVKNFLFFLKIIQPSYNVTRKSLSYRNRPG